MSLKIHPKNLKVPIDFPVQVNIDAGDAVKAQREMMQALKARKEALEEALKKKTEELKLLCIKEGELTGFLPAETPIAPGEQPPQIRRRVGTAFTLSSKVVDNKNETEDALSKLELEYELQGKISKAAYKLAHDKSVSKYVRKQRRLSYNRATVKLKEMEKKLSEMREQAGKGSFQPLPGFHGMYNMHEASTDDRLSQSFCEEIQTNTVKRRSIKRSGRVSQSFRDFDMPKFSRLRFLKKTECKKMNSTFRKSPQRSSWHHYALERVHAVE